MTGPESGRRGGFLGDPSLPCQSFGWWPLFAVCFVIVLMSMHHMIWCWARCQAWLCASAALILRQSSWQMKGGRLKEDTTWQVRQHADSSTSKYKPYTLNPKMSSCTIFSCMPMPRILQKEYNIGKKPFLESNLRGSSGGSPESHVYSLYT